jgi:Leucine-rich repeat (LRR) protein
VSYTPHYIQEQIRRVKQNRLKVLDLSYCNLIVFPSEILTLDHLERLILHDCYLGTVPASLRGLTNLTTLDLSSNGLTEIPPLLFDLQNLTYLSLRNNDLTAIDDSISKLQNLSSLRLDRNKLQSLPDSIRHLRNLGLLVLGNNPLGELPESIVELIGLTWLDLTSARISSLPVTISKLEKLRWLDAGNNGLTELPSSIGQLQNLLSLGLSNNRLSVLPETITQLHNLTHLHLDNNLLSTLPSLLTPLKNLEYLNLASNELKELPPSICHLSKLVSLNLAGNPLQTPPPEVVHRGTEGIKNYFKQVEEQGQDRLYEAKLLIVGEGGAGKTTLARKIEDANYELQEEDSTRGIEIVRWTFPMENDRSFRVSIWDFGGQEIYHATHQFFLTKRSLYLLVADTRREDTDFYYWLNVIDLLSDNSPLLVIKNEKQDRSREINENQYRGQFPNFKETISTNLATNRGLPSVIKEIKHYIRNLPHVGTVLPKTWVKVREALEREPRNYITLEDFVDVCELHGFTQLKDKLQLSGYLHDLGVCLHFQEDPLLRRTVILKPKWGTDAVYRVLDNDYVKKNFGRFTKRDLANIWHEAEYGEIRDELLQLMINFKLCYQIPNSDLYIAPQLLTENQSDYRWDDKDNLVLRYTYEFMPKGILTQFIVAMHRLIANDYVWKTGVVVTGDDTLGEVIEFYGKREIRIRITGKHKKELATIIMYEIDKIHDTYPRLKVNKLIPCNCSTCAKTQEPHFYSFKVLRQFIGDLQDHIQCQKSYEMVGVMQLIDDVVATERDRRRGAANQIFISYSHRDSDWLKRLETMLKPLTRGLKITLWADTKIASGANWKDEIEQALAASKVALLIVSPNFLASDFISEHELPVLLSAAKKHGLRILWMAVSHSLYKETEIAEYQALHDPTKPLDGLPAAEQNQVLFRICENIKESLEHAS